MTDEQKMIRVVAIAHGTPAGEARCPIDEWTGNIDLRPLWAKVNPYAYQYVLELPEEDPGTYRVIE